MPETPEREWVVAELDTWENAMSQAFAGACGVYVKLVAGKMEELERVDLTELPRWHREWIAWQKQCIMELKDNRKKATAVSDEDDEPQWSERAGIEVSDAMAPGVNLKAIVQNRPNISMSEVLGQMAGNYEAMFHPDNEGTKAAFEIVAPRVKRCFEPMLVVMQTGLLPAIEATVNRAHKRPLKEKRKFMRGYALGLQNKPFDETGALSVGTQATAIYLLLASQWKFVQGLRNVSEVHKWLEHMLGKTLIGDVNGLKRIEKICQRMSLRLGPPGRPARS